MDTTFHEKLDFSPSGTVLPYVAHIQYISGPGATVVPHYHEYIEVLYCIEGEYDIWLNGKYYNLKKGGLVVVNSMEIHTIIALTPGKYSVLRFLPEIIHSAGKSTSQVKYTKPFIAYNKHKIRVFNKETLDTTQIPYMLENIQTEYKNKEYGYEMAVCNNINNIFLWILRYWDEYDNLTDDTPSQNAEITKKIQMVMDYVTHNFSEQISAENAAKMCNLSYSYFSRVFKKVSTYSFSEYLNYIRITEAERLIAYTDLSMTEIAMQTGFSTSSYFIHQFKQYKKISPKQYRKNLQTMLY